MGIQKAHCALISAASAFCISLTAPAYSAGEEEDSYSIYFADVPLSLALNILGRDLGVEFSVDASQRQRVRDLTLDGAPDQVITELMREIGMESFRFNGQIFVAPIDNREVRLVRLGDLSPEKAMDALKDAGLLIPEFEISEVANGKALVLSGPVKYLALSESVIASVVAEPEIVEQPVRVRRAGKLESETGGSVSGDVTAD